MKKARRTRLAACPRQGLPQEHAFVIATGRLAHVLHRRDGEDYRGLLAEDGVPVREGKSGASAHAPGCDTEPSGLAKAAFEIVNTESCPDEPAHVVVFGEASDAFAGAFFDAFATEISAEEGATLTSAWLLPARDEKPRACHAAASFIDRLTSGGSGLGSWCLLDPQLLAASRGTGRKNEPLQKDDLTREVLHAFASPRLGAALAKEADESLLYDFVPAVALGASLLVLRERSGEDDLTLRNLARLAALNSLLPVDPRASPTLTALVRLSNKETLTRDVRDVETQVKLASSDFAPDALSTTVVVEAVRTINNYYAGSVLAFGGAPLGRTLTPLIEAASRWNASGADRDVVARLRDWVKDHDRLSARHTQTERGARA